MTRPRRGPTKTTPGVSSLIAASPVKTDLGNMGAGHKLGALTNGEVKKGMIKTAFFSGVWNLDEQVMARINDLHLRHLFPLATSIMDHGCHGCHHPTHEVINSHPISSHLIPYLQMGTHIPWFHPNLDVEII